MSLSTAKLERWKRKGTPVNICSLWGLINHSRICLLPCQSLRSQWFFPIFFSIPSEPTYHWAFECCVYHGEISNDFWISFLVYSMLFLLFFPWIALFLNVMCEKMTFFSFCENILPQINLYVGKCKKCRKISYSPKSNKKVWRELMLLCGSFSYGEIKLSSSGHNLFLDYCFHLDIARIFLVPRMKFTEVYRKILS